LRVSDNGRGITAAEIKHAGAIGLLGMRERAAQAGALLEIAGVPGKGTVVTVRAPVPTLAKPPRRRIGAKHAKERSRRTR
jgi:nitrate/nitrite-specific signal transduction histidine kinase